jgi:hypothetical protein
MPDGCVPVFLNSIFDSIFTFLCRKIQTHALATKHTFSKI